MSEHVMAVHDWGIPQLRADRLGQLLLSTVYAGGVVTDPASTFFVWRTSRFPTSVRGGVLGFYVDDYRLEALWNRQIFYAEQFHRFGWGALIEPDFSLWREAALVVQVYNVYRTRWLGRLWQEHGLAVIPSLNWSDPRSFTFCFKGIPIGASVVACECRTAGKNAGDRGRFLAGLAEGVRQVQPQHVLIYGGKAHASWLTPGLPSGPHYLLLDCWSNQRNHWRQRVAQHQRQRQQRSLFSNTGGDQSWEDEAQVVAGLEVRRNVEAERTKAEPKEIQGI